MDISVGDIVNIEGKGKFIATQVIDAKGCRCIRLIPVNEEDKGDNASWAKVKDAALVDFVEPC